MFIEMSGEYTLALSMLKLSVGTNARWSPITHVFTQISKHLYERLATNIWKLALHVSVHVFTTNNQTTNYGNL